MSELSMKPAAIAHFPCRAPRASSISGAAIPSRLGFCFIAALTAAVASLGTPVRAEPFYHLESAVAMKGAAPNWDYVTFEPGRSYLFIARREEGVTVYDAKRKNVIGRIESSEQANATTLVPQFDRGYTTNEDGSTTVFKLSSLKTLRRVKLAESADSAVYEPVSQQVAFTIGDSKKIVFLDPKTDGITGKLELQSVKLEHPTADGQGNVFVAQRDRDSVVRIDARLRQTTAEWKTVGCEEPNGLAFDRAGSRLFIGCRGKGKNPVLAVMDSESGTVVATSEIGRGNDGVVYDPETRKIYTSNGVDGNLVVIDQVDANTYKLAEATTTRPYARTMALDPKTKKVYLITAEGTVDPTKKINRGVAPFYPNKYFPDTFTLLTLSPR
jgi:DNA-binding beta-propeller fold protein YncE